MNEDPSGKPLPRWLIIPAGAIGLAVTYLCQKVFPFALAEAAGFSTIILIAAAVAIWPLRYELAAQVYATVIVSLTMMGLFLIHWPEQHQFEKFDGICVWLYSFALVGGGLVADWLVGLFNRRKNGS